MRRFVIGDIHGCGKALRSVLETIDPDPEDEVVFLGDYVDRGPESRDVVNQVLELRSKCRVVALRGNHEIMLMAVAFGGLDASMWLNSGGRATVASYGGALSKIPPDHIEFFRELRPYYEIDDAIFVHAGYAHDLPMARQNESETYWNHLPHPPPPPHCSGKRVFVGHTPQASGDVLDFGHIVCLDTYCFGGGYLTAMEISGDQLIQADRHGHLRRSREVALGNLLKSIRRRLSRKPPREDATDPAPEPKPGIAGPGPTAGR